MKMSSLILNSQLYILKSNLAAKIFFTSFSSNFVGLIYLPLSLFNRRVNVSIRIIAFNQMSNLPELAIVFSSIFRFACNGWLSRDLHNVLH